MSPHHGAPPLVGDVPRVKAEPVADTAPTEDDDDKSHDDGDLRGLDAYAQAAISALKQRSSGKDARKKTKRGATPAAPMMAATLTSKPTTAAMKRPAAKMAPWDATRATIMKSMPELPTDGSKIAPVLYNGGVVYTSLFKRSFRALKVRGDNYSEASAAAWKTVIDAIDNHKKAK